MANPNSALFEAAYKLAVAADKAADVAVHEKIAAIVKLHAKLAIPAAWIPVPVADVAAMAANTWAMYVRINKTLDLPFAEHLTKSLATGIGTNLLSNVPVLTVASAMKFIPGVGTVTGGAIMSVTLYAVTIASGILYMRALALLLNKESELTEVNLKGSIDALLNDKATVKEVLKAAKKEYRADNT